MFARITMVPHTAAITRIVTAELESAGLRSTTDGDGIGVDGPADTVLRAIHGIATQHRRQDLAPAVLDVRLHLGIDFDVVEEASLESFPASDAPAW